jgi:hypothetical protein
MKMVSRAFLLLLVLTAAGGLTMTRPARAQGTATQTAVAETRPVRLVVSPAPSSGDAGLALDRLREGIEAELGRPVSVDADAAGADVLSVIYQPELESLTVFYKPHGGRAIVRTVRARRGLDDVEALTVLLAGNLARDQAGELLGPPPRRPAVAPPIAQAIDPLPETPAVTQAGEPGLLDAVKIRPVVWSASLGLMNLGVSFSDSSRYVLLHVSGHLEERARLVGAGLAVGTRVPLREWVSETDLGLTAMHGLDPHAVMGSNYGYTNDRLVTRLRTALAYSPFPGFSVFAGVAFAMTTHRYGAPADNDYAPELFGGFAL